ncbi:MAG: hypothetical protein AB1656_01040 [Candidatus Omnitrophota bacterium]
MPLAGIVLYIVYAAIVFPFRLLPEDAVEPVNDAIVAVVCSLGSYCFYRVSRLFDREDKARMTWFLFAIGVGLDGLGHVVYSAGEFLIHGYAPYPHPGDIFIIIGEGFNISALGYFYSHFKTSDLILTGGHKRAAQAIFFLYLLVVGIWIIYPIVIDPEESIAMRISYLIYPCIDITFAYFGLFLSLSFIAMGAGPIVRPWLLLTAAYILFVFVDSLYAYLESIEAYHPYLFINPGWALAYCLIAHAAYRQKRLMSALQF